MPALRDLNPILVVGMTHYTAAIPLRALGKPMGTPQSQADEITRALDILLTGFRLRPFTRVTAGTGHDSSGRALYAVITASRQYR